MRSISRRFFAVILCFIFILSSAPTPAHAAGKTGVGMAEWALRAYNEGWKYLYGGSEEGSVDCSGLIRSYINGGGGALALLNASPSSGNVSSMPNIHGLGLWCEGHAGVYVGKNSSGVNMAVDARNSKVNVVYSTMDSRSWNPWVKWFKVKGVSYPTTGWETYNGDKYYYYNGEFVTGIFTVDGETYDFGQSGALIGKAKPTTTTTTTTTTAAPTTTRTTTTAPPTTTKNTTTAPPSTTTTTTTTAKPTTTTEKSTTKTTEKKTTTTTTTTTTTAKPTTTTTTAAKNSLEQGMSGNEVTAVQRRLIELGYLDAKATGYFGKQTEAAVKAFQRNASLTPDGIVGEVTKAKLFADDAPVMTTTTATTATTTTTAPSTTTTTATTAAPTTATDGNSSAPTETTASGGVTTTSVTTGADGQTTAITTTTAPKLSASEILLALDAEEYANKYLELEFGTSGDEVSALQQRLSDLGYYDGKVDGYFGKFLYNAVSRFQLNSGLIETGIADVETQAILFSDYAPISGETLAGSSQFTDEDYMIDEGDYAGETDSPTEEITELKSTDGLSVFSTEADIPSFTRQFGSGGALQTLGITGHSEPVVLVVYSGDCFELTEELQATIDNCVFF